MSYSVGFTDKQMQRIDEILIDLHNWVARGCPDDGDFDASVGICSNVSRKMESVLFSDVCNYLFEGNEYPFNIGPDHYTIEMQRDMAYKNPKRLQWLADKVKEINNVRS
jgi:hypothetical protein